MLTIIGYVEKFVKHIYDISFIYYDGVSMLKFFLGFLFDSNVISLIPLIKKLNQLHDGNQPS